MALGKSDTQRRFDDPVAVLGDRLKDRSIYKLLAEHGHELFPDEYFADCYSGARDGRPTVPARILATVMLLQAFEGLSDREASDRLGFDLRWQAAAGVAIGEEPFHPTVLVGARNRLRASSRPRRLFEDTKVVAKATGALGQAARVLDSTPIFDAVATEDTVTQVRAVIRKLLVALDQEASPLASEVRAALVRDDEYATPGKPPCDWDDRSAREALVDALVRDANAALGVLSDHELKGATKAAAELLALVAGQDVEEGADGVFRIVRGVAKDRVISTVDVEARHGHKSKNRHFDGYKAHLAIDPDSELITEVVATPANTHDAKAVPELLADEPEQDKPIVLGDSAYADGQTRTTLAEQGFILMAKCPPVRNATGGFTKDRFVIDLEACTVTCPAGQTAPITGRDDGSGVARFAPHCGSCPLRSACTKSRAGRSVAINANEAILQQARAEQTEPEWIALYRANRPLVERKIAHLVRRSWGGRHGRVRGLRRIATDLDARASAINFARLAILGLGFGPKGWTLAGG
ncbi:MAG: IS1182 family transposase [Acidimicrobiales bacterium]